MPFVNKMVEDVCKRKGGSRKRGGGEKRYAVGVFIYMEGGVIKLFFISKLFSSLSAAKNGHLARKYYICKTDMKLK